jgi:(E)-4-hydroxy-3-methylbut-2-enyl-diphosphate synthase
LLSEGIGDTVRVSLSEAPEKEIPVAKEIIRIVAGPAGRVKEPSAPLPGRKTRERYYPQVYTGQGGTFLDEQGRTHEAEVLTLEAVELMKFSNQQAYDAIINPVFSEDDPEKLSIDAAALLGRFFIARHPSGLCITNRREVQGEALSRLAFSILQATEARITRTRYISCPTCGRTKFNLEEAVRRVKDATSHLTGMKIAVMGCVVNGPGEMAGADYGYVGAAEGKVHIYRGTEAVMKNVPEAEALGRLLELIESDQAKR